MATGTVRTYHPDLGYGYIVPDDGGAELAVYYDSVIGAPGHRLVEGQRVEYDPSVEEGRPVAERVRPL